VCTASKRYRSCSNTSTNRKGNTYIHDEYHYLCNKNNNGLCTMLFYFMYQCASGRADCKQDMCTSYNFQMTNFNFACWFFMWINMFESTYHTCSILTCKRHLFLAIGTRLRPLSYNLIEVSVNVVQTRHVPPSTCLNNILIVNSVYIYYQS